MKRVVFTLGLITITAYLAGPIVAGYRQIGLRDGPVIYPPWLHEPLYTAANEARRGTGDRNAVAVPQLPIDTHAYRRPLFYGLERKPRPDLVSGVDARLFPKETP